MKYPSAIYVNEDIYKAQELVCACVKAWREAKCLYSHAYPPGRADVDDPLCDGENHLEECPCELARQDLIAAHNALEMTG